MVAGVVVHLLADHEHAHTHDDGHHLHTHDVMPEGAHSHLHQHRPLRHTHPHVPDAHHRHGHWRAAQRGWKAMIPMPASATVIPATSQAVGRTPSTAHSHTMATQT